MTIIKNKYLGIIYILCSAFFFSLMNVFVRLSGDLPSVQKSFFRNFVAMFFAFYILKKSKTWFSGKRENIKYLILRSMAGTIGILCNFYAVDHLVLADASLLNKMSPFFAILFSFLILKEKITPLQVSIVVGAFIGCLFIMKPTVALLQDPSALIGLGGGMFAGMAYTYVRSLGEKGEKGPFIVFFFSGFSCLVTLPFLIFNYHPMSKLQIVYLLLAGLAATGGQFSITNAYMHAPAKEISIYDYSQILFSAILGFVLFGQFPDLLSWIGYLLICLFSILLFIYNNHKNSPIIK